MLSANGTLSSYANNDPLFHCRHNRSSDFGLQVVSFEEITKGEGMAIHSPITCSLHGEEQPMKYFCNTCQILICNECMMTDHRQPGHQVERVSDIEHREVRFKLLLLVFDFVSCRSLCTWVNWDIWVD